MGKCTAISGEKRFGQSKEESSVRISDFLTLIKARVNIPVTGTAGVGFAMQAEILPNLQLFLHTLFGTFLVASSAAIANQAMEQSFDREMIRTRNRPLVTGKLKSRTAVWIGVTLLISGGSWLLMTVNLPALLFSILAYIFYVGLYTPLKRVTPYCTFFGAVSGALPVLVGWSATDTKFGFWVFAAFTVLFIWQIPHFLAIAWLHRTDYLRAGYRILPSHDTEGYQTAGIALAFTLLLIKTSLVPIFLKRVSFWYGPVTLLIGIAIASQALLFFRTRNRRSARILFIATLAYLPAVYTVMLLCRTAAIEA